MGRKYTRAKSLLVKAQIFANRLGPFGLFALVFLYAFLISLLLQLVVLPYIFPSWNAGDGLLIGFDSAYFHQIAVELAEKIHTLGWQEWELLPEGQLPSGIAAAIYAISVPRPYMVLPLSVLLHAFAVIVIWKIIAIVVEDTGIATLAICPLILFPSSFLWVAQISRDGFSILGISLVLLGWLRLFRKKLYQNSLRDYLLALFHIVGGFFLSWLSRPYLAQIILGASIGVLLLIVVQFTHLFFFKNRRDARNYFPRVIFAIIIVSALVPISSQGYWVEAPSAPANTAADTSKLFPAVFYWTETPWLPKKIDNIFESLAAARSHVINGYPEGKSNIDHGIVFTDIVDIIVYVPRAMVIMFFAPFPPTWFESGSLESFSIFRRVAGFEMVIAYLCLAFLAINLWKWKNNEGIWVILLYSSLIMLPLVLAIPNVGTLYRYRYAPFMTLVALGVALALKSWLTSARFQDKTPIRPTLNS